MLDRWSTITLLLIAGGCIWLVLLGITIWQGKKKKSDSVPFFKTYIAPTLRPNQKEKLNPTVVLAIALTLLVALTEISWQNPLVAIGASVSSFFVIAVLLAIAREILAAVLGINKLYDRVSTLQDELEKTQEELQATRQALDTEKRPQLIRSAKSEK